MKENNYYIIHREVQVSTQHHYCGIRSYSKYHMVATTPIITVTLITYPIPTPGYRVIICVCVCVKITRKDDPTISCSLLMVELSILGRTGTQSPYTCLFERCNYSSAMQLIDSMIGITFLLTNQHIHLMVFTVTICIH